MKALLLAVLMVVVSQGVQAKDYTSKECPVVGNTNTKIYHVPGDHSYAKMLRENKSEDNRRCFNSKQAAQGAGFKAAKRQLYLYF